MLTRRGLFKTTVLALVSLALGRFAPVHASAVPFKHRYLRTRQWCTCGKQFCYEAAGDLALSLHGSVFLGDAGRLHLPPGRMFTEKDRQRVMQGHVIPQGTSLLFMPTVCLTDAEHAQLERDAKPFGIAIQKGCEA